MFTVGIQMTSYRRSLPCHGQAALQSATIYTDTSTTDFRQFHVQLQYIHCISLVQNIPTEGATYMQPVTGANACV